jgi:hypothetical protein
MFIFYTFVISVLPIFSQLLVTLISVFDMLLGIFELLISVQCGVRIGAACCER